MIVTDIYSTRFKNQTGILDVTLYDYIDIAIVGVGSIGSFLALAINKLGFGNLVVIDNDTVEEHNVPTQLYSDGHIGKPKSKSVAEYLTGNISSYVGKVSVGNKINADVVFVCVDSLEQREQILKAILSSHTKYGVPKLLIDGRMHRLVFEVYTILLDNDASVSEYLESLHQEEYGGACTEKGIIQNIFAVVAVMVEQFRKVLEGHEFSEIIASDLERYKFISMDMPDIPKEKPKPKPKTKAKPKPKTKPKVKPKIKPKTKPKPNNIPKTKTDLAKCVVGLGEPLDI